MPAHFDTNSHRYDRGDEIASRTDAFFELLCDNVDEREERQDAPAGVLSASFCNPSCRGAYVSLLFLSQQPVGGLAWGGART